MYPSSILFKKESGVLKRCCLLSLVLIGQRQQEELQQSTVLRYAFLQTFANTSA
jgi:hypothetical protein